MSRRLPKLPVSPLLTGAVMVLIGIVALLVTYNASQGLPFVPTYDFKITVPDAGGVAPGREVRVAGKRVGIVESIEAVELPGGRTAARLGVKVDIELRPIKDDSQVTVRPIAPLAAKYIELELGRHGKPIDRGNPLPLSRARPTVELTDAFNLFDDRTRRSLQGVFQEFGDAFTGRGQQFNELLDEAPALVARFERVARNASDRRTRLDRFIRGGGDFASELSAARRELGSATTAASVTLGALANARRELAEGIAETPSTETAGTRALRVTRPVLADAEAFLRDARPGLRVLRPASEQLHLALVEGTPVLRRAVGLADQLVDTLRALERLARDRATRPALHKLGSALKSLRPTTEFVAPAQLVCNYIGLGTRNLGSALSQGDESGTGLRFVPLLNRASEQNPQEKPVEGLHVNPYPHGGQNGECEAGNEPYLPGTRIGNVAGDQGLTESTSPPPEVGRP